MTFDLTLVHSEVEAGNIRAVTQDGLTIYNYTPQAQWSKHWNEATMMCRGLIVDGDGQIIARPFPKFFNWGEVPELHHRTNDQVMVGEKIDGSLGILYPHPSGEIRVATRGSFSSDQALWATQWLRDNAYGLSLPNGITPLVEIVYPQNRIVVDYGDTRDLFLLTGIDNETGRDVDLVNWWIESTANARKWVGWDKMALDTFINKQFQRDQLDGGSGTIQEGWVVRFVDDDVRVKFKYDDYVRLHKIITNTSAKGIWEHMAIGDDMNIILDNVPDEFYEWATKIIEGLAKTFVDMDTSAQTAFGLMVTQLTETDPIARKKQFASWATQTQIPDILFAMYDGKPYKQFIWKRLKPESTKPFKTEVE